MIKKIRFSIQLIFFILTSTLFLGFIDSHLIHKLFQSLHFFPTLSYLSQLIIPPFFHLSFAIFLLPILFGRLYCSFICPVGFIQDIIYKIIKFFKPTYRSLFNSSFLSNFILIASLMLLLSKSNYQGIFDHFTNFARLFSLNSTIGALNLILIIFFISFIIIAPLISPRFFCQNLCPSGAIYRMLNRFSFLQIIPSNNCNLCGVCEHKCPTLCIEEGVILKDKCITCFECLESCPQNGFHIIFKYPFKKEHFIPYSKKRRTFFKNSLLLFSGIFTFFTFKNFNSSQKTTTKLILPPGAKSLSAFYSACTSCNLCLVICPTKVIKSGSPINGISGQNKPYLDFDESYCSYECNACLSICPTNALTYCQLQKKQVTRIGESKIDETSCIPYKHKRICGSCAEHCPTGAISMVSIDNVLSPKVNPDYCVGCGICQKVCPTRPKSIIVHPLAIHTNAYSPKKSLNELTPSKNEDFPF